MQIVIVAVIGLIGLGIMVFIHEAGHFLAARAVGVEVEAFALGWGPTVWRRRGKWTEYRLAAFPIGGYCKLKGEQDLSAALERKAEFLEASPGSIFAAKPWKRIVISFAGPLVNLLFALVTLTVLWWVGYTYHSPDNRIILASEPGAAADDKPDPTKALLASDKSPAYLAGLRSGDRIVSVDGVPVNDFAELQHSLVLRAKRSVALVYERDGKRTSTTVVPTLNPRTGGGQIGIVAWEEPVVARATEASARAGLRAGDRIVAIDGVPVQRTVDLGARIPKNGEFRLGVQRQGGSLELPVRLKTDNDRQKPVLGIEWEQGLRHTPAYGLPAAMGRAYEDAYEMISSTVYAIAWIFQGQVDATSALQGPGRIVGLIGSSTAAGFDQGAEVGLRVFFQVMAMISIALFFGNLLPIPALDGGQILMYAWEAVTRRPLRLRTIQRYQMVGFALVLCLLLFAVYGDILSIGK